MKTVISALVLSSLLFGTAAASNIVPVSEGEVSLAVTDARNELTFDDHGRTIRFMMNRNDNDWFELQMATETHAFQYGLYWRIREAAVGGLQEKAYVTQYEDQDSGRYFYGIELYSDQNNTYHACLVGMEDDDTTHEYYNSYYFAGNYISNPHIWAADGKLYLGDKGPNDQTSPRYELYWSKDSNWFGYNSF